MIGASEDEEAAASAVRGEGSAAMCVTVNL